MICKTEQEKEILREGGKRLAEIRSVLAEKTKAGVSTVELDELAYQLCTKDGDLPAFLNYTPFGAPRPFPSSICVSVNDVVVHGIPTEDPRVIKEGDLVTIDVGLVHKGLITDSAITVEVGEVKDREHRMVVAAREALDKAIKKVRAGVRVGEISKVIEQTVKEQGFGVPQELGGHGVGKSIHEEPSITNVFFGNLGPSLREGEVIAIEPIITMGKGDIVFDHKDGYTITTKDGSKSAHSEHTLIVTKNGSEILTV
ncbi:MAG: type I methionyl aminopeptidase [Candidatus Campbellbacteria bacterium]|nr:type I methionyl aminopeptidase [Candidatus Campbellbacteria bacterium]